MDIYQISYEIINSIKYDLITSDRELIIRIFIDKLKKKLTTQELRSLCKDIGLTGYSNDGLRVFANTCLISYLNGKADFWLFTIEGFIKNTEISKIKDFIEEDIPIELNFKIDARLIQDTTKSVYEELGMRTIQACCISYNPEIKGICMKTLTRIVSDILVYTRISPYHTLKWLLEDYEVLGKFFKTSPPYEEELLVDVKHILISRTFDWCGLIDFLERSTIYSFKNLIEPYIEDGLDFGWKFSKDEELNILSLQAKVDIAKALHKGYIDKATECIKEL